MQKQEANRFSLLTRIKPVLLYSYKNQTPSSHKSPPHQTSLSISVQIRTKKDKIQKKMEVSMRKPYFIEEEDDGFVSLSEMEAGVSSPSCYNYPQSYYYNHHHHQYSVSSPRSGKFHDFRFDNSYYGYGQPHFLDSCFLCKKRLGDNRDIFMYRYFLCSRSYFLFETYPDYHLLCKLRNLITVTIRFWFA